MDLLYSFLGIMSLPPDAFFINRKPRTIIRSGTMERSTILYAAEGMKYTI